MDIQAIAGAVKEFASEGTQFMYLAALLSGMWLGLSAAVKLAKKGLDRGDQSSLSWSAILGRLLVASLLVTMADKMQMIIATNGEAAAMQSVMSYARGASSGADNPVMQAIWAACATFCVFMGTVGFFRGLYKFDKACQGGHDSGDAFWSGLWHCIGGALAVAIFR